ncbi:MAG: M48 family metallopeptidase [Candidatus Omnitrophota bacterium]
MQSKLRKFSFAGTLALVLLLSGCVTVYNPATGKNEALFIDTQTEVSLGQDLDRQMQKELKILKNPEAQDKIEKIGSRVAFASDRRDLAYHFRIVKDPELNAFAIPGGYVYVNSGLMQAANEDELACVLGHEIGHIAARHSVKKLQSALGYQILLSIALGLSNQQNISRATDIIYELISLGYSRQDEFLADKLSARYAKRAGFNPKGMATFLEKLKEEAAGTHYKPVFLSSHPDIEERIRAVENEIALNP